MSQISIIISQRDPISILSFEEALFEIEYSLAQLRKFLLAADFEVFNNRLQYRQNLVLLKQFYEAAERLAMKESKNV